MRELSSRIPIEIETNIHKLLFLDWLLADTKHATNFLPCTWPQLCYCQLVWLFLSNNMAYSSTGHTQRLYCIAANLRGIRFCGRPSAKISQSNFHGWTFLNWECAFRLFISRIQFSWFACQPRKVRKFGYLENFQPNKTITQHCGCISYTMSYQLTSLFPRKRRVLNNRWISDTSSGKLFFINWHALCDQIEWHIKLWGSGTIGYIIL